MKFAVASLSGTEVDQHFGHAERFLLYEYHQGKPQLVGTVEVEKYCTYDAGHPFRRRQFNAIIAALAGCQAVVTAMIGDYPLQELKQAGLPHFTAAGPIETALQTAHDELFNSSNNGTGGGGRGDPRSGV
ncbi:MAG: dinitrogenase iron-molybdenum cofactor biosynthesis protein [Desulfuromonadales bacterium]|nr:dinitrogenase iron-molybdenum cofactor biosynthesis protein [Desulfuromonadales bacterium]